MWFSFVSGIFSSFFSPPANRVPHFRTHCVPFLIVFFIPFSFSFFCDPVSFFLFPQHANRVPCLPVCFLSLRPPPFWAICRNRSSVARLTTDWGLCGTSRSAGLTDSTRGAERGPKETKGRERKTTSSHYFIPSFPPYDVCACVWRPSSKR